MIERLVRALTAAMPGLAAADVADALWVAAATVEDDADVPARPVRTAARPVHQDVADLVAAPVAEREWETPHPVRHPVSIASPPVAATAARAVPVGAPTPQAFDGPQPAARSVAAFRRIRRPGRPVVDIDATVEATADVGRLAVVTRPASEPAMEAAVVVDESPVTALWAERIDEFARLLERCRAFRRVTRWTLGAGPVLRDEGRRRVEPRLLGDTTGNRLVLLVTDTVADYWYAQPLWDVLQGWGETTPTVLVNVLPENYWASAGVGHPHAVLRSRRPGGPNIAAEVRTAWWHNDEVRPGTVAIPVASLTAESFAQWTKAMVGGSAWTEATYARRPDRPPGAESNAALTATERVRAFHAGATVAAQSLARVLSSAPVLSLPLIRVIQRELLGGTEPGPLAEVMVSGLLERVGDSSDPTESWLAFRPEVAELLQRGMTATQEWDTFEILSRYLEEHAGSAGSVRALLLDPQGSSTTDIGLEPFAAMGREVAQRLGIPLGDEAPPPAGEPPVTAAPPTGPVLRRHARVVIVGDPGIGKTALAAALVGASSEVIRGTERYTFAELDITTVATPAGLTEIRQVAIWDPDEAMAAYPFLLGHTLRDAAVVVVAVDAGRDVRQQIDAWSRAVTQAVDRPVARLLVTTRDDLGAAGTGLDRPIRDFGFAAHLSASAVTGAGIAELRATVLTAVDWNALPSWPADPEVDEVLAYLQQSQPGRRVVLTPVSLMRRFRADRGSDLTADLAEAALRVGEATGATVRLTSPGTWTLPLGEFELMLRQIVRAAETRDDGLAYLPDSQARTGRYYAEISFEDGPAGVRPPVVFAIVDEVIASGHAYPVDTDNGRMLVFPSLMRAAGEYPAGHGPGWTCTFSGSVSLAVAVLTVALANTHDIHLERVYRHAATFTGPDGEFGFSIDSPGALNRLTVWCSPSMDEPAREAVSRQCLELLGRSVEIERITPAALLRTTEDPDPRVRAAAVRTLDQAGREPSSGVSRMDILARILRLADDRVAAVREPAIRILGESYLDSRAGRTLLMRAVAGDPSIAVRAAAAAAIGVAPSQRTQLARPQYLRSIGNLSLPEVTGYEHVLQGLAEFATADDGTGYECLQAPPGPDRSALMAQLALRPPPYTDVLAFFTRVSKAFRADFVRGVVHQLVAQLGLPVPTAMADLEPYLNRLLPAAAQDKARQGRRLLLIVDGLDEDRGRMPSIAGALPPQLPAGVRVVATTHARWRVPDDVPAGHPLRDPAVEHSLESYEKVLPPEARLERLSARTGTDGAEVFAMLTASRGGLGITELADLTGKTRSVVRTVMESALGSSVTGTEAAYSWSADVERHAAGILGVTAVNAAHLRLREWADRHTARGWPADTPVYLLTSWFALVSDAGDTEAMLSLATDRRRRERLLRLPHGREAVVHEVAGACRAAGALAGLTSAVVAAEAAAGSIAEPDVRAAALTELACAVVAGGDVPRASALTAAIDGTRHRQLAVTAVAGAFEEALAAGTVTVRQALAWLEPHGGLAQVRSLLLFLCRRPLNQDESDATAAAALTWLDRHGDRQDARDVLIELLRQPLDAAAGAQVQLACFGWLRQRDTSPAAAPLLGELLAGALDARERTAAEELARGWLARYAGSRGAIRLVEILTATRADAPLLEAQDDRAAAATRWGHDAVLRREDTRIIDLVAEFFHQGGAMRWYPRAVELSAGANLYPALLMLPFTGELTLCRRSMADRQALVSEVRSPRGGWLDFWERIRNDRPLYGRISKPLDGLSLRARVTKGNTHSLGNDRYDLGTMFFVAEVETTRLDEFDRAVQLFVRSLWPGAPFAAAFLRAEPGPAEPGGLVPGCLVDVDDVERALAPVARDVTITPIAAATYGGDVIVATGRRR